MSKREAILSLWDSYPHNAPGGPKGGSKRILEGSAAHISKMLGVSRGYVLRAVYDRRQKQLEVGEVAPTRREPWRPRTDY